MDKFLQWILDNALEVAVIVATALIGFGKMRAWITEMSKDLSELRGSFDKHLESEKPHAVCQVEGQRLANVAESLDEIRQDIKEVRTILLNFIGKASENVHISKRS